MEEQKESRYCAYYRISTKSQDKEVPVQKSMVRGYLNGIKPHKSFTEIESGKKSDRPRLMEALEYCNKNDCKLVVAKLDRLSRDLEFIAHLQKSKVNFVCADMPSANSLTISVLACVAQWEREQISNRTKMALAEKKKQGVKLGYHNPKVMEGIKRYHLKRKALGGTKVKDSRMNEFDLRVYPKIVALRNKGYSLRETARMLNEMGVKTRRNGAWRHNRVGVIEKRNKQC